MALQPDSPDRSAGETADAARSEATANGSTDATTFNADSPVSAALLPTLTVRDLRRRWKPTKLRLNDEGRDQQLSIRIHRSCSWIQRIEEMHEEARDVPSSDMLLIVRWISFNAMYARWDAEEKRALGDTNSFCLFLAQLLSRDRLDLLADVLDHHRPLVEDIFEDVHLSHGYWRSPSEEQAARSLRRARKKLARYETGEHSKVLEGLIKRIYLIRCQLMHGGATFGGKLNREPLDRCATMLGHLLPALLIVLMDHGVEDDWGPICYPPDDADAGSRAESDHARRQEEGDAP